MIFMNGLPAYTIYVGDITGPDEFDLYNVRSGATATAVARLARKDARFIEAYGDQPIQAIVDQRASQIIFDAHETGAAL